MKAFDNERREVTSSQEELVSGRHIQSESEFNGSFYKHYEPPKIKDFEKSTFIKFEEFTGNDQLESDPNRKHSERISDRIYESLD